MSDQSPPKIYLLPNLMTAGNLFCGFTATLKILEGALLQASNPDAAGDLFHTAVWYILGACFFDLLDGRLARLGGHESAFGREFDWAVRYLTQGRLDVRPLLSAQLPLARAVEAFTLAADKTRSTKVQLTTA